jgi:SEC-C motif-containing protein
MTEKIHNCPCLSGRSYYDCCEPLHLKQLTATAAEQLMRSRYSASYLGKVDYLVNTLTPSKRHINEAELIEKSIESTQWLGLRIVSHKEKSDKAEVEFIAFYQDKGIQQLHERSNFIKQDGLWFYVDGQFLPDIKLQRNEPCFCGSGKKLKRCHNVFC